MKNFAYVFFIVGLIAALFAYFVHEPAYTHIAKILSALFFVIGIVSFMFDALNNQDE